MKKAYILLLLTMTLLAGRSRAQVFYRNVINITPSVGIGGLYSINETKTDSLKNVTSRKFNIPTTDINNGSLWGLHFQYGIVELKKKGGFGVGGYIGTRHFILRDPDENMLIQERSYRFYILAAEGSYHFYTRNRLDPFVGVSAGMQFKNFHYNATADVPSVSKDFRFTPKPGVMLIYSAYGGFRYYFANNMSVFAEGGIGYYYAKLGLSLTVSQH